MLLTERQITAQEACDGGLVTRIFSEDRFRDEVDKVVKHMASLPPQVQNIFIFWFTRTILILKCFCRKNQNLYLIKLHIKKTIN